MLPIAPEQRPEGETPRGAGPQYVTVGEVVAPHGLRGEVRVYPLTDCPERFTRLERVRVVPKGGEPLWLPIRSPARLHARGLVILGLEGVESLEAAERLRGARLEVPVGQVVPLPEGRYYLFQLVGLRVETEEGRAIGRVVEVLTAKGNDVYVVEAAGELPPLPPAVEVGGPGAAPRRSPGGRGPRLANRRRTVLIPAVREIVRRIDLEQGRIVIRPIPGLW